VKAKLVPFHHTKLGLVVFAIAELAIAYGLASISIDRGGFWWYVLTLAFLVGAVHNLVRLGKKVVPRGYA
jgi:hypothetical protein